MMPVLQSRWRLEENRLVYYGLRNAPNTLHRKVKITPAEARAVAALDGTVPLREMPGGGRVLKRLIDMHIVVDRSALRRSPASLEEARFCRRCAANDFAIPGLEFDKDGLCPICQTEGRFRRCKNVTPIHTLLPRSPHRKYDAAVFYTGGKDSSYLLYHLARVQKLRILALCWETPYMSPWARESVEHARQALPEVDFIVEKAPEEELKAIYRELYRRQRNVCLCPAVAYVLFLPRLAAWRVPYLVLGTEPAQCKNFIYNGFAPPFYYRPWIQALARLGFNFWRVVTLRPPHGPRGGGVLHDDAPVPHTPGHGTAGAAPQRDDGEHRRRPGPGTRPDGPLPGHRGAGQAPGRAPQPGPPGPGRGGRRGLPLERHQGDSHPGDRLVDAPVEGKGLHTSCSIERCKEYSQMVNFREMKSGVIPFSAVEMALASACGTVSREEAVRELKEHSGFTPDPPAEWADMVAFFAP